MNYQRPSLRELPDYVVTQLEGSKYNGYTLADSITADDLPERTKAWLWEEDTEHLELYAIAWLDTY